MGEAQGEFDLGTVGIEGALKAGLDAPQEKWARTLAELVDTLVADRMRRGESEQVALNDAQRTVLLIAQFRGGHSFYLPRGDALAKALRDRSIYLRARRGNTESLAQEYGVSVRRIEQIVAEQHAVAVARGQGMLFPE